MAAAELSVKPCVMFVDDERNVVETYSHVLGDEFEVHITTSGREALQKLRKLHHLAVLVSDFYMPLMDGATFLHEAMLHSPQVTRILLTGSSGIHAAKEAVNKGQIFRFLTKPCALAQLREAIEAGVDHHRLLNAERRVLQETLIEAISALMEVLAVTNPVAFGRAQHLKDIVQDLAKRLECDGFWQLEAAALLSQIGYFAVSPELAEKLYYGRRLNDAEQVDADTVPAYARRLLENIPRLEPVIQILTALEWSDDELQRAGDRMVSLGARILEAAIDYDVLARRGVEPAKIQQEICAREQRLGTRVTAAIGAMLQAAGAPPPEGLRIRLREAKPGMRLREELRTPLGALLVPIGFEISARLIDRLAHVAPAVLDQVVSVDPPMDAMPTPS